MSWRTELLQHMPWVTVLNEPTRCDGIKRGTVALKDLYSHGPARSRPPRGIQDKSRCKNRARWYYHALQPRKSLTFNARGYGKSGNYCFSHLLRQVREDRELQRTNSWMGRNEDLVARVKRENPST